MKLVLEIDLDEYPTVGDVIGVMSECVQSFSAVAPHKANLTNIMEGPHAGEPHRIILEGLHERHKNASPEARDGHISARLAIIRTPFNKRVFAKNPVEAAPEDLSKLRELIDAFIKSSEPKP